MTANVLIKLHLHRSPLVSIAGLFFDELFDFFLVHQTVLKTQTIKTFGHDMQTNYRSTIFFLKSW